MASSKPRFKLLESSDATLLVSPEYRGFIAGLKSRVQAARISAARAVNSEIILLYWDIGQGIVEKQQALGWGESVVELVAADLRRAFPEVKGFSLANVWRMRQFYAAFTEQDFLAQAARELGKNAPRQSAHSSFKKATLEAQPCSAAGSDNAILAQAVRELAATVPWGHHVLLLGRIKPAPELLWYLHSTARLGWSRNVLLNQIKAGAYERSVTDKKSHNFGLALPEHLAEQADEMLKSSYSLEFLGIRPPQQGEPHRRRDLTTSIETPHGSEGEAPHTKTARRYRAGGIRCMNPVLRPGWANPDESGYPEPMRGRFFPWLFQAGRAVNWHDQPIYHEIPA